MSETPLPYHASYPAVVNPPVVPWTGSGELLAWRAWRLAILRESEQEDYGPRLLSLTAPCIWRGPMITADTLPAVLASRPTGIHALKPDAPLASELRLSEYCWVSGLVALSGRVMEHAIGYRAERAVVRELRLGVGTHLVVKVPRMLQQIMDRLEECYDAPVDPGCFERHLAHRLLARGGHPQQDQLPFVSPDGHWRLA